MWTESGTSNTEQLIADIQALRDYGTQLLETSRKLRRESNHIYSQSLKNKDLRHKYAPNTPMSWRRRTVSGGDVK